MGQAGRWRAGFGISYEVSRVAQYLQAPTLGTVKALKRILAYLAGTVDRVGVVILSFASKSDDANGSSYGTGITSIGGR